MRDRSALSLGERLEVEAALDAAFVPLREQRTDLSALRVRAALRWGRAVERPAPRALRRSSAVARLSELSVAIGMSAVIFGAALGPAMQTDDPRPGPIAATAVRTSGPTIEEQHEIHATKHEWLDSLRARLDAVRSSVTQHDRLDPSVLRPSTRRLDIPVPRTETAGPSGPY